MVGTGAGCEPLAGSGAAFTPPHANRSLAVLLVGFRTSLRRFAMVVLSLVFEISFAFVSIFRGGWPRPGGVSRAILVFRAPGCRNVPHVFHVVMLLFCS